MLFEVLKNINIISEGIQDQKQGWFLGLRCRPYIYSMAENANAEKNILIKFNTAVCSSIFDSHDKLVSLM